MAVRAVFGPRFEALATETAGDGGQEIDSGTLTPGHHHRPYQQTARCRAPRLRPRLTSPAWCEAPKLATATPLPSSINALRGWCTAWCWPASLAPRWTTWCRT